MPAKRSDENNRSLLALNAASLDMIPPPWEANLWPWGAEGRRESAQSRPFAARGAAGGARALRGGGAALPPGGGGGSARRRDAVRPGDLVGTARTKRRCPGRGRGRGLSGPPRRVAPSNP